VKKNSKGEKVFTLSEMPEEVASYFKDIVNSFYEAVDEDEKHIHYRTILTPHPELGNDHVPISQWFVRNGAAKGEVVVIALGE
jgi:hypothetical protein